MRALPLCVILPLALLALAGCEAEKEEPATEAGVTTQPGPSETTAAGDEDMPDAYTGHFVFVTEHGGSYHAPSCPHVRGKQNLRPLTREEAVLEGFEPCKDCNPGPPR